MTGASALIAACGSALAEESANPGTEAVTAHAKIVTCEDEPQHIGWARLAERRSAEGVKLVDVQVRIDASAIAAGKHAVHVHETGECQPCGAANGHFDPGPASMSSPDGNHPFHAGDLINIELDGEGSGEMTTMTSRVTLSPGPLSIFDEDGSAFIIHVDADTYCPEGEAKGCAGGARAACGVIQSG
jgi:Cu-Zn family superoxide dismutase